MSTPTPPSMDELQEAAEKAVAAFLTLSHALPSAGSGVSRGKALSDARAAMLAALAALPPWRLREILAERNPQTQQLIADQVQLVREELQEEYASELAQQLNLRTAQVDALKRQQDMRLGELEDELDAMRLQAMAHQADDLQPDLEEHDYSNEHGHEGHDHDMDGPDL